MYINLKVEEQLKGKYYQLYLKYNRGIYKIIKRNFLKKYLNMSSMIQQNNKKYLEQQKKENIFLNNFDGCKLDDMQKDIVLSEEENTLVVAGAGSGKTLTLLARIIYLLNNGVNANNILCLSLTNSCANNLKAKLKKYNIDLDVLTFHKLGFRILKESGYHFKLAKVNDLINIIDELTYYYKVKDIIPLIKFKTFDFYGDECDIDNIMMDLQNIIFKETSYYFYLKQTILTFINLFKNNNYDYKKFDEFLRINAKEKNKYKKRRGEKYLLLIREIYNKYEAFLESNNKIDFNDMINKAIVILEKEKINDYKYIIVDEYQDTSLSKCLLLKKLQEKTSASLLAIGDDWQSIYRFTGTDLDVFTDFAKYFEYTKIFKLSNTYRNSNELLKIMTKFIMKNKRQIAKNLVSKKSLLKPILVYYYDNNQEEMLYKVLRRLKGTYLILGRNNSDINLVNKKYQKYFMTVHKAKGLESDVTVIINLENSSLGFPNKIINDDILKYVGTKDVFPYEEERRLFYVALTRTKTCNILLVNKNNPSMFALEIIKENPKQIITMICPKCQKMLVEGKKNTYFCQDYPKCKYRHVLDK